MVRCPHCGEAGHLTHAARYVVADLIVSFTMDACGNVSPDKFGSSRVLSDSHEPVDYPYACGFCGSVDMTEEDLTWPGHPIDEDTFVEKWGAKVLPNGDLIQDLGNTPENRVWSIVETEGADDSGRQHWIAMAGIHFVNRLGFCITKAPWPSSDLEAYWFKDDLCKDPPA